MPRNHGLGPDDDQGPIPARPESAQKDPEEPIFALEAHLLLGASGDREFLAQGDVLKGQSGLGWRIARRKPSRPNESVFIR
jgi:hypothetical protein